MTNRRMLENAMSLLTGRDFRFSFDQIPLRSPRLDAGRRFNLLLAGLDQVLGRTRMLASPPVLQIEPTNICNLACPLCPSGRMARAKGMMSAETFETILRDLGDTLMLAILYGWGEPFLNPALPEMMALFLWIEGHHGYFFVDEFCIAHFFSVRVNAAKIDDGFDSHRFEVLHPLGCRLRAAVEVI